MVDTLTTKKVTELTENTAMSDEDLFMVGSAGTASLRKLKWSNIWNTIKTAILGKLVANNLTTTAAGYLLDARQGKALDDKISKLNTDSVGNSQIAFVTFDNYGDNYWISSPIPCFMADRLNIMLSENVKNTTSSVNAVISSGIFEIRKYKNCFYLLTNNTETAGYIFSTLYPNRVWEVYYNVS